MKFVFLFATLAVSAWGLPAAKRTLEDDFMDIQNLLPVDQISTVLIRYMAEDSEVQTIYEFLLSPKYADFVKYLDELPEFLNFLNYLEDNGVPAYEGINQWHRMFGIPDLIPPNRSLRSSTTNGVKGMLKEIMQYVPVVELDDMIQFKLRNRVKFADFVDRLKGDEFSALVDKIRQHETFQYMIAQLKQYGVPVDDIEEYLHEVFGWGKVTRSLTSTLNDDLNDFLKLVPQEQITNIVMDYLANDDEVGEVMDYMTSEDFGKLVITVEGIKEYLEFINYIQAQGVDIYAAINKFHDFLGLPPLAPPAYRVLRQTRAPGVRGMLDAIEAVIPVAELQQLFQLKMKISPDFAALIAKMSSDEFKGLVAKLKANPTFQHIEQDAVKHGVDLEKIREILQKIFGWGSEVRSLRLTSTLNDDLNDFLKLVPQEQITNIVMDYLANDDEVGEVMDYMTSEDFSKLVTTVEGIKEYLEFINYIQAQGVDIYAAINKFHDFLGLAPLTPPAFRTFRYAATRAPGVRGMLDAIEAVIPVAKLQQLFQQKLKTSPDFAALITKMSSDEFKGLVAKLKANPTFQHIEQDAVKHGVDLEKIREILQKIFGWGAEVRSLRLTSTLNDDLNDFLKLVPQEQITNIVMDYLANDDEVGEVMDYMTSEDFSKLVTTVEGIKEYLEFINYIQAQGVDIYAAINKFHDFLGLPPLAPPAYRVLRQTTRAPGVRGMLDAIEAVIPVAELQQLFQQKLKTSPDFAALITKMSSDEFKGLVAKLKANPTFQHIEQDAVKHGVDLEKIREILQKIFGWGAEVRSLRLTSTLNDDLNDFLKLVPQEQITNIVMDYLANDEEVGEVMDYMTSEDFGKLVITVEGIKEYLEFINYIQAQGVDIYAAINKFHDFLGLPPLAPPAYRVLRQTTRAPGVRGMVDAIEAVIPVAELQQLFQLKMKISPDFAALITKMSSDEFKGLVAKLKANPTFQHIEQDAVKHGVDLEKIREILQKIFGWGAEVRSLRLTSTLNDDLKDFLKLVPQEEITTIVMDYLANDDEVGEVMDYMTSEDFSKLVTTVEGIKEYLEFINYIQAQGVDVYAAINKLHDFLGLAPLTPPAFRVVLLTATRAPGVRGMLDAIEAVIPADQLQQLFQQKLKTSPDFAALVAKMSSDEFKGLVAKLKANPTFQHIEQDAVKHGVDLEKIREILQKIFGWN